MTLKEVPERAGGNVLSGESDRRNSVRYALSAIAEVMDRQSGARMAARVSDIGRDGCYVDALNVFPAGTQVVVLIRHADLEFKATAAVAYALPSMGMGIRFKDVAPEMRSILEKWITEAQSEFSLPFDAASIEAGSQTRQSVERKVLYRLLDILMRNNLLSQTTEVH